MPTVNTVIRITTDADTRPSCNLTATSASPSRHAFALVFPQGMHRTVSHRHDGHIFRACAEVEHIGGSLDMEIKYYHPDKEVVEVYFRDERGRNPGSKMVSDRCFGIRRSEVEYEWTLLLDVDIDEDEGEVAWSRVEGLEGLESVL
jgi:hypothetical protein